MIHAALAFAFHDRDALMARALPDGVLIVELAPMAVAGTELRERASARPFEVAGAAATPSMATAQPRPPIAAQDPEQREPTRRPDDPVATPVAEPAALRSVTEAEEPATSSRPAVAATESEASRLPNPKPVPAAASPEAIAADDGAVSREQRTALVSRDGVAADATTSRDSAGIDREIAGWTRGLVEQLERNKRFPAGARARREEGTAIVLFSVDRKGAVMAARITRSSGSPALDAEALAIVRRAAPFQPPPAALSGATVPMTFPMRFEIR